MKPFKVSQSGRLVAEGVVFTTGVCAVSWLKEPQEHKFFDSLKNFMSTLDSSIQIVDNTKKTSIKKNQKFCKSKDPDALCNGCNCWKMTRQFCS